MCRGSAVVALSGKATYLAFATIANCSAGGQPHRAAVTEWSHLVVDHRWYPPLRRAPDGGYRLSDRAIHAHTRVREAGHCGVCGSPGRRLMDIILAQHDIGPGGEQMSAYFVMAKMDNGDGPFDEDLVNERYPTNFMLVPGHVWLVVADADSEGSYDVAKSLGLVSGGTEEASGMVVPAKGYWGFAHKSLWQLLQPDGHPHAADRKGRLVAGEVRD